MSADLPIPPETLRFGDVSLRFVETRPGDPIKGLLPWYHFRILDASGTDVGHINYRVGHSRHVTYCVGNIGFAIESGRRGRGYAYQACNAIAPFAFTLMESIVITVNPDNPASIRTIEKLGAKFIDIQPVPEDDPHYESGARLKRRYRWAANVERNELTT